MKTTIHFVKDPHPATFMANAPPIGKALYDVAESLSVSDTQSERAVVAYRNGRIIAAFKYRLSKSGKVLHGCGTVVTLRYRRKGLASKLWEAAIKKHKPTGVEVPVTTKAGLKLMNKIKAAHPELGFCIINWI